MNKFYAYCPNCTCKVGTETESYQITHERIATKILKGKCQYCNGDLKRAREEDLVRTKSYGTLVKKGTGK